METRAKKMYTMPNVACNFNCTIYWMLTDEGAPLNDSRYLTVTVFGAQKCLALEMLWLKIDLLLWNDSK